MRSRRQKRDLHGLTSDGMVACNPRDREAAHRAEVEGIATRDVSAVTCAKCRTLLFEERRQLKSRAGQRAADGPAFRVRRATRADADAFIGQRLAVFREVRGVLPAAEAEELETSTRAAFESALERGNTSVWLAVTDDGEVVGSAALHVFERFPSPTNPVAFEGYISHVYVAPAWRRRGIGTAVMGAIVEAARARDLRRIRLHATDSGRALYETLGFRLRSNDMDLRL